MLAEPVAVEKASLFNKIKSRNEILSPHIWGFFIGTTTRGSKEIQILLQTARLES